MTKTLTKSADNTTSISARTCGACGSDSLVAFSKVTLQVGHLQPIPQHVTNLSGKKCAACEEIFLDADSAKRYAEAADAAVLSERSDIAAMFKRVRSSFGLTQKQAALITGGGHNAFSRYERGEAQPLAAVVSLIQILDDHPQIFNELPPVRAGVIERRTITARKKDSTRARKYFSIGSNKHQFHGKDAVVAKAGKTTEGTKRKIQLRDGVVSKAASKKEDAEPKSSSSRRTTKA